ncbi:MAG: hypothetical protein ACJATX_000338, partial [Candidatus Paceibacteria bacterium]
MKEIGIKNIITAVFVVSAVLALLIFSGVVKLGEDPQAVAGNVLIWGDISSEIMEPLVDNL